MKLLLLLISPLICITNSIGFTLIHLNHWKYSLKQWQLSECSTLTDSQLKFDF